MKSILSYLGCILFFIFLTGCSKNAVLPNIVLIVADDLGYTDLSCYGSTFYETPNLDRLASQGVRFTNGYATCPVCSPTRASIQTGKYPVSVKITDWIPGRAASHAPSPRDRWLSASLENNLKTEETTIADVLRENNYKTFFAGKWHLGETAEFWPQNQGYEINKGGWNRGMPNINPDEGYMGYFSPYGNSTLPDGPDGEYLPERLTDETIRFIKENQDAPFYACLSFYLVHTPLQALEEKIKKYKHKATQLGLDTVSPFLSEQDWMLHGSKEADGYKERILQSHGIYAAMVEALDENIGRLLNSLENLGIANNTLIIFTSDNGGLSTAEGSPTANFPLRGGKGWLYEGGIRVPYIVKYPNKKHEGRQSDIQISSIDILPTILSALDQHPKNLDEIEGINITPFLEENRSPERALYWHYPHYSNQGGNPGSVIIQGNYKLIHDFETGKKELYNLASDMGEQNNVSDQYPQLVNELYSKLDAWRTIKKVRMMEPNPDWNKKETMDK